MKLAARNPKPHQKTKRRELRMPEMAPKVLAKGTNMPREKTPRMGPPT